MKKLLLIPLLLLSAPVFADDLEVHANVVETTFNNINANKFLSKESQGWGITYSKDIFTEYLQVDIGHESLGNSSKVTNGVDNRTGGNFWTLGVRGSLPLYKGNSKFVRIKVFGMAGLTSGQFRSTLSLKDEGSFDAKGSYYGGGITVGNYSSASLVFSYKKHSMEYEEPIAGTIKFSPGIFTIGISANF